MIRILLFLLPFLALHCSHRIHVKKRTTYTWPALNAVDVCRQGLCVLPVWNGRSDTIIPQPTPRDMEAKIKRAGHRQLRLVPFRKVAKRMERKIALPNLLFDFEKKVFAPQPFDPPKKFWSYLDAGYFLRISLQQGEIVRTFSRDRKFTAVLHAQIFHAVSRQVVWKANAVCSGRFCEETDNAKILDTGIDSIVELLPVRPKISYITPLHENW